MFKAEVGFSAESAAGKCIAGPHRGADDKRIPSETVAHPYSRASQPKINADDWGITHRDSVNAPSIEDSKKTVTNVTVTKTIC